jgi:D-glycero-D-manno-heptose 1,7-bisphosphate phosphatase
MSHDSRQGRCPAVFLDRDRTLIEDPGYLSDPSAVKLLPAVETALRSLAGAGFKLVVVTNQSAIARGLLTVEGLETLHDELTRQLSQRGVRLDGIYYCPFHPEGTVEAYARESEDRKPRPGMLLRAAKDLEIDLASSWMVGDSPRDVEAGQRAGCRTVRVRTQPEAGPEQDEDVQADFTVRNLLEAAHVILRESGLAGTEARPGADRAAAEAQAAPEKSTDAHVLGEILLHLRRISAVRGGGEFSAVRLAAAIFQALALIALGWGLVHVPGVTVSYESLVIVHAAMLSAVALQLVALTLFLISRQR